MLNLNINIRGVREIKTSVIFTILVFGLKYIVHLSIVLLEIDLFKMDLLR